RTKQLAGGMLAVSVAIAGFTYLAREAPPVRRVDREPTIAAGSLPGSGASVLSQAPGRPQVAELDRLIRSFGHQTDASPSAAGFAFLGQLELERARLTGDVASYARAGHALEEAVSLAPQDPEPQALLAGVRFTTHDFLGAFELADRIYAADRSLSALAVRGDAELELGRYGEAAADYRVLAAARPGDSSTLIRLSRLAFLHGDGEEAARLAAHAERAAAGEGLFGASLSRYAANRGRLSLEAGNYEEAARHYRRAVDAAPDYHVAISGLAGARAAQGRFDDAIRLYERAVALVPEPASLAALGDLYAAVGDERAAADRYATVEAIATLQAVNRRLYDRQLALFRADHGGDLDGALEIARQGLVTRRDIYGYDVLAWVLFRLGRLDEARQASDSALAMGTPDARLWFHAGMISAGLGDDDRARTELTRALDLHPAFDPLLAPRAAETLAELGGPV
ncbi:MAG TPA: tetratricopeptide repeat protein, partial [Actinomycetota bacterium]